MRRVEITIGPSDAVRDMLTQIKHELPAQLPREEMICVLMEDTDRSGEGLVIQSTFSWEEAADLARRYLMEGEMPKDIVRK